MWVVRREIGSMLLVLPVMPWVLLNCILNCGAKLLELFVGEIFG